MGLPRVKQRSCLLLCFVLSSFLLLSPQTIFAVKAIFTYDAAGRLLTVQYEDGQHVAYVYDPVGNMTQQEFKGFGACDGSILPGLQLLLNESKK